MFKFLIQCCNCKQSSCALSDGSTTIHPKEITTLNNNNNEASHIESSIIDKPLCLMTIQSVRKDQIDTSKGQSRPSTVISKNSSVHFPKVNMNRQSSNKNLLRAKRKELLDEWKNYSYAKDIVYFPRITFKLWKIKL